MLSRGVGGWFGGGGKVAFLDLNYKIRFKHNIY